MSAYPKRISFLILITLSIGLVGCGGSSRTVKRIQTDQSTDISGRWNDTDSRLTAQSMIKDLLSKPWLLNYQNEHDRIPVMIVGSIRNKSSEHIPVDVFIKDIQKELINSGQVTFVASKKEREELREERLNQQSYSSIESAKDLANEQAADFMLQGTINSIVDSFEGQRTIFYQVDLELVDLENNTKVWIGDKKIKKAIAQDKYSW